MAEPVCDLDAISDPGSAVFTADTGSGPARIMVVRKDGAVRSYVNSCPHTGAPLDFVEGQFLDAERRHILCSLHGALFRIVDGACLSGPCEGRELTPVPVMVRDGTVFVGN